jgi:hypothetical protein
VTLFRLGSTRRSARFVAFIELCFVGAFVAADYELRRIGNASCPNFANSRIYFDLGLFGYGTGSLTLNLDKTCAMLKASWVFGIMNTFFFFFTFILALLLHRHQEKVVVKEVRRSRHSSRRGHSRSGSRRSSGRRRSYDV